MSWTLLLPLSINEGHFFRTILQISVIVQREKNLITCESLFDFDGKIRKVFQNHFCSFATSVLGFIYHIICVIGVFISNLAQRDGPKAIQKDLFSFMRG